MSRLLIVKAKYNSDSYGSENRHLSLKAGGTINCPALSEGQFDNLGQESQNICFPFDLVISYSGTYLKEIIRDEANIYVQGCILNIYL